MSVVLLDSLPSAFGMRVRIALAEKGIEYEYREENLQDKSPLLLEMNPVHKMIPVLIHNDKPICESLIILHYIDQVWHDKSPLLPLDPYKKSQACFWADYIDKKVITILELIGLHGQELLRVVMQIYSSGKSIILVKGEEREIGKKELIQSLKTLEAELGDQLYFGGETIGFVDVALLPYTSWFYSYGTCGNFNIEIECPKLAEWAKRCKERESISKSLTDPHKVYTYVLELKQRFG